MEAIRMTEEALQYKNEWVAFSPDFQRVVGHGPTPDLAVAMARMGGEEGILFFIPEEWPGILVL